MIETPPLIPELVVADIGRALDFYRRIGFAVLYDRPDERFAMLDLDGARLMIEQPTGRSFVNGPLEAPYGRGMNLQIRVPALDPILDRLRGIGHPLFLEPETRWYRMGAVEGGNRQCVVADPDGYLLRLFEDLGQRPGGLYFPALLG